MFRFLRIGIKVLKNIILFIFGCNLLAGSCDKPPYKFPYKNIKGFVVAKETCNLNVTIDYWVIDMTLVPNTSQVGDTIIINGITYTNALKTTDLAQELKITGTKVSIDYNIISTNKIQTVNCSVANPETYLLKELFIINQGRIP